MEKTIVTCCKERLDISSVVEIIQDGYAEEIPTFIDNSIFGYLHTAASEKVIGSEFLQEIEYLRFLRDAFRNIKVVHDDE